MNSIKYINDEPLAHLNASRKSSFLWKLMYKRAMKKKSKSLISIENIKKIIFNTQNLLDFSINAPLGQIHINKEAIWIMDEKEEEYFVPLSISFSNGKESLDVVLLEGEIDLRRRVLQDEEALNHKPLLVAVAIQTLEKSFDILLEEIKKAEKAHEENKYKRFEEK